MDFTKPWDSGDVTFIIQGKKIYANRGVLSMSSEVFKTMFTSDFKEKKMTEIPLPGKNFNDFLLLMEILHPQLKYLSYIDTSFYQILPLAHEYQIQSVLQPCLLRLLFVTPSIRCLNMIEKYNIHMPSQRKECMKYLKDTPLPKLRAERGFKELKQDILLEVLNAKVEKLEPLKAQVRDLVDWEKKFNEQENCPSRHFAEHKHGVNRKCPDCSKYRLAEISKAVEKCDKEETQEVCK